MILRGQVSKDQLQFESEIEKATRKKRVKKRKKNKEKLEKNHQRPILFTLKFFRKKTWLKSNHHSPKEHLEITLCSKG